LVTRWDPRTRAGAIAVRTSTRAHDTEALKAVAENVREWASYQKLAGDVDNVETSPITGTYDWRAYIQEEAKLAQQREERATERKPAKKPAPQPSAAPSVFYA